MERTVGFDVASLVKGQSGLAIHVADQLLLSSGAGLRQRWGLAVLVRAGAPYDSADHVPIPQSRRDRFQEERDEPFAPGIAVRTVVEGPALAVRGKEAEVREEMGKGRG